MGDARRDAKARGAWDLRQPALDPLLHMLSM